MAFMRLSITPRRRPGAKNAATRGIRTTHIRALGIALATLAFTPSAAWAQGGGGGPDYFLGYFILFVLLIIGLAPACIPAYRSFEVKKDDKL